MLYTEILINYRPMKFNKSLRILVATNSLVILSSAMLGPIYAAFIAENGGSIVDAGVTFAAFAITAGFVSFASGYFSDKLSKRWVVVTGYSLMALGLVGYIFVDSLIAIMLLQILIGSGEAIYSPAFDALYSEHLDAKNYGEEWGTWEASNYFMLGIGSIVGASIVSLAGFDLMFAAMACLNIFSASILILSKKSLI